MQNNVQKIMSGKNMKPQGITPSILLLDPRFARNVSMAIRLCSCFDVKQLWYTGKRVSLTDPGQNETDPYRQGGRKNKKSKKPRLPREERMKGYRNVEVRQMEKPFDHFPNAVPVAVELAEGATQLQDFEHPENAVYVFGPEDGSIDKISMGFCHHRIVIPTRHCLNLTTAIAMIFWDRKLKRFQVGNEDFIPMEEMLAGDRAFLREMEPDEENLVFN